MRRRRFPEAARAIARWVRKADGDDLELLLRAVVVTVRASTERVTIADSIPLVEADPALVRRNEALAARRARLEVPVRRKAVRLGERTVGSPLAGDDRNLV